jgi:hypothetical protein
MAIRTSRLSTLGMLANELERVVLDAAYLETAHREWGSESEDERRAEQAARLVKHVRAALADIDGAAQADQSVAYAYRAARRAVLGD